MNNRLYIENLPPSATEASLRELFSKQGSVKEVKLVMDAATGRSRGRAFVTMATPELAQSALKSLHSHKVDGRNIVVSEARPLEAQPDGQIGHGFEAGISNDTSRLAPASGGNNGGNNRRPMNHRRGLPPRRRRR